MKKRIEELEEEVRRLRRELKFIKALGVKPTSDSWPFREELNRQLKTLGYNPGELQATYRGLLGEMPAFDYRICELALLDAFANEGGATVWHGDGSSCAVQIIENLLRKCKEDIGK